VNVIVLRNSLFDSLNAIARFQIRVLIAKDPSSNVDFYRWSIDNIGRLCFYNPLDANGDSVAFVSDAMNRARFACCFAERPRNSLNNYIMMLMFYE
jgi:hypothetical protein